MERFKHLTRMLMQIVGIKQYLPERLDTITFNMYPIYLELRIWVCIPKQDFRFWSSLPLFALNALGD